MVQRVIQSHPGYPLSLRMRLKCLWLSITWEELSSHTGTQTVVFISQDLLSLPARLRGASIIFIPRALRCRRAPSLSATPGSDSAALGRWATASSLAYHIAAPARRDKMLMGKARDRL